MAFCIMSRAKGGTSGWPIQQNREKFYNLVIPNKTEETRRGPKFQKRKQALLLFFTILLLLLLLLLLLFTKRKLHAVYKITQDVCHYPWHAETALIHYTRGLAEWLTLKPDTGMLTHLPLGDRGTIVQRHSLPMTSMFRRVHFSSAGLESANAAHERYS